MTSAAPARAAAGDGLAGCPVGVVPIVWNNADLFDLAPETPFATILDEAARLGYDGCQFGRGFPEGDRLRDELQARGLRLAERYCALPSTPDGPGSAAAEIGRTQLDATAAAGGEVLVVALDGSPERDGWGGRAADGAPRWPAAAFRETAALLAELAQRGAEHGVRVAFHPHTATWVEAPDEAERLAEALYAGAGLCLDVGHWTVGGGDPVAAVERFGELVTHVHLKDVDRSTLGRLRAGELPTFEAAVRERIFTELGNGVLDLDAILAVLAARGYGGWLMVEQDSSWLPPSEAAAIGRRVLAYATRRHSPRRADA